MASIRKRGKTWEATVSVIHDGKRERVVKGGFEKKGFAKVWADDMESLKRTGKRLVSSNMLLSDYFLMWYEQYKKADIREISYIQYENTHRILTVYFPNLRLNNLSTLELQSGLDAFGKTHMKMTAINVWTRIKASLRDALLDDYVQSDVWSRVKIRAINPEKKIHALSVADFEFLQNYLYKHLDEERNRVFLTALETGARRGEIYALTGDDISTDFKTINISKSYSIAVKKVTAPKNEQSGRIVPVSDSYIAAMTPYLVDGPIFTYSQAPAANYFFKRLLAKLELPDHHFHDLRHSHVSYLLYKGVSLDYISQRIGHKNTRITMDVYSHMLSEQEQSQRELLLRIMQKNNPASSNVVKTAHKR